MGLLYWVRTLLLILAFAGTVFLIREINQPVSERRVQLFSFLGSPPDPTRVIVNLCPTRITKLSLSANVEIVQRGLRWTKVTNGQATELDQVAVEKWFSAYCLFEAQKVAPSADVTPVLKAEFVKGPARELIRSAAGDFEWDGRSFRSDKMAEALTALETFPEAHSK